MKRTLLLGALLFSSIHFSYGQQNLVAGVPYTQDFNSLGSTGSTWTDNTTIQSWYAAYESIALTNYNASTGSSSTGSLYSLGGSNAIDRALGSLPSGTTGKINFGLRLINNGPEEIKSLTVSFTGEQWRYIKDAVAQKLFFSYTVSTTAITSVTTGTWTSIPQLDFSSPNTGSAPTGAIDGNDVLNRTLISQTFAVTIPIGSEIMLRFTDVDDSGSDMALGIDDFSVTSFTTLPISLTSFTAKPSEGNILLNWTTASEKNNLKFEVLKSVDGRNFKSIATLDGALNSDTEKFYAFVDENPYSGTNYYQLKQTDFNGTSSYSQIIIAEAKIEKSKISVYASSSMVTVTVNSPNQTEGLIALFDINGKKLDSKNLILNKGYNEVTFDQTLLHGVYIVNLLSAGKSISTKFIK